VVGQAQRLGPGHGVVGPARLVEHRQDAGVPAGVVVGLGGEARAQPQRE
jgi:hypothetical protein